MESQNDSIEDCSTHYCVECGYITLGQKGHNQSHQITENNDDLRTFALAALYYFNSKCQLIVVEKALMQIKLITDNECIHLMGNCMAIENFSQIISSQKEIAPIITKHQACKLFTIIKISIYHIIDDEIAFLIKSMNENKDQMNKYLSNKELSQFHYSLCGNISEKSKKICARSIDFLKTKLMQSSAIYINQLLQLYGSVNKDKYANCITLIANHVISQIESTQDKIESLRKLMLQHNIGNIGETYQGGVNGKRQGRGKMSYNDGSVYDGEWKDDAFWGKGTLTTEKDVYCGDFINGSKEGIGWISINDNTLYVGEWKQSSMYGWGVYLYEANKHLQIANEFKAMSLAQLKEEVKKLHYAKNIEFLYGYKNEQFQINGIFQKRGILFEGIYIGDGSFIGDVIATDGEMFRYEGNITNFEKNGRGIFSYSAEYYIGNFLNNYKHGKGVCHRIQLKTIYVGNFKKDVHDGEGLLIKNYDVLDAQLCDHLEMEECLNDIVKEGVNLFAIDGAEICYGEWKNGILNGKGFIRYADNTFYIGQISDEKRLGNGVYLMSDTILEGYFSSDLFVKGVRINMPYNIIEFATAFATHNRDRLPIINGSISYSNGSTYEGEIKGTIKHGVGTLRLSHDEVCKGTWKFNVMDGDGEIVLPDGTTYKGQFVNGKKHGKGVLKSCTGASYDGEWRDDRCDGIGKLVLKNGDIFEGKVKDFMPNGEGTFTTADS